MSTRGLLALLLCAAASRTMATPQVQCHYIYGGEVVTVAVPEQAQPYGVAPRPIGSYFLWLAVLEPASWQGSALKITTYVGRDSGPVPIHQGVYPRTQLRRQRGAWGFTGLQQVYEPVRDSELQYWCEAK